MREMYKTAFRTTTKTAPPPHLYISYTSTRPTQHALTFAMRGARKLHLYGISTVTLKKRLFADAEERPRRRAIARRDLEPHHLGRIASDRLIDRNRWRQFCRAVPVAQIAR